MYKIYSVYTLLYKKYIVMVRGIWYKIIYPLNFRTLMVNNIAILLICFNKVWIYEFKSGIDKKNE